MPSDRVHGNEDGHSGGRLGDGADAARHNHRTRFHRTGAPASHGLAPPTTRKTGDCHRSERRRTPTPSTSAPYAISFSSSSPGNSLTDGYFMISFRAIFHAFWTIHDSDRSCRVASSWISLSMSSGKYRDCLRLSEPAIRELVSRTAYTVSRPPLV